MALSFARRKLTIVSGSDAIDHGPSSGSSTSSLQEPGYDASQVYGIDRPDYQTDKRGEIGGESMGKAFMVGNSSTANTARWHICRMLRSGK